MLRRGRPGLIGMAARTAVVAGTATAVSGRVASRQQRRAQDSADADAWQAQQQQQAEMDAAAAQAAAAPPPAPASGGSSDLIGQLNQLSELRAQGILSEAEFAAAKGKLLGS